MIQEHHSAETSVTVPAVVAWQRYPTCPKCGYSQGMGIPVLRRLRLAFGKTSIQMAYCNGDHDSTVNVQAFGVRVDMPVECFGIFDPHLHLECALCRYRWLMAVKPAPAPRRFDWPAFWSVFWKCLLFTLLGVLIDAAVARCETPQPKPRSCRVEWVAPTGQHNHGDWMQYDDAMKAADGTAFLEGVPAEVICRQRSHFDHMDWVLFASDEGVRILDGWSTHRALACACNHESVLPDFISHHTVALYGFSVGVPLFNLNLVRMLRLHGRTRLARSVFPVDIGVDLPGDIRNLTLPSSVPQRFKVRF